ncbi:hypothetical protein ACFL2B_02760 [Patescibacteria group bacterium]
MTKNVKIIIVLVVVVGAGAALFTLFASDLGFTGLSLTSKPPTITEGCGDPNVCEFPDECLKCPECNCECGSDDDCTVCDGTGYLYADRTCVPTDTGSECQGGRDINCGQWRTWDPEDNACRPWTCDPGTDSCTFDPTRKSPTANVIYGQDGYLLCNCGDGNCNTDWENADNCIEDCHCGNGICEIDEYGENSSNCAEDCQFCDSSVRCPTGRPYYENFAWMPGVVCDGMENEPGRCVEKVCDPESDTCVAPDPENANTGWCGNLGFSVCHCGNGVCEGVENEHGQSYCREDCAD